MACAGKITKVEKEISESMALIRAVRADALAAEQVTLFDLCSGHGLTGIIAAHLWRNVTVIAVDRNPRCNSSPQRFREVPTSITTQGWLVQARELASRCHNVVVASHPCRALAHRVIATYLSLPGTRTLAMMPCCIGRSSPYPGRELITQKIGRQAAWAAGLAWEAHGDVRQDKLVLSPCNYIVVARSVCQNC